jgi:hypothetical protein
VAALAAQRATAYPTGRLGRGPQGCQVASDRKLAAWETGKAFPLPPGHATGSSAIMVAATGNNSPVLFGLTPSRRSSRVLERRGSRPEGSRL